MTLTFAVPLPPRLLHPNSRPHYMARGRAVKKYRMAAGWQARAARPKDWNGNAPHYRLSLTFYFRTSRQRDDDGLTAWWKSGRDGLTDAGLWPDDHLVTAAPPTWAIDRTNPRVVVTVETEE